MSDQHDFGAFLKRMELLEIQGFTFDSILPGGGSNITATYRKGEERAVAKFFFLGPHPVSKKKYRNEIDNHIRGWEMTKVFPEIYGEFASADGVINGYLMEFIDGQSLDKVIPSDGFADENQTIAAFFRILWAYQHSFMGVVHCDLHPGNIFFESSIDDWLKRKPESPEVRILDLGASISPYHFGYEETFDEDLWKDFRRRYAGSFYSLAPEFFSADFYRKVVHHGVFDCWALGLLLYRMTTGRLLMVADSLGEFVELTQRRRLQDMLDQQIEACCAGYHLKVLMLKMMRVDTADRIPLHVAGAYMGQLYNRDSRLLDKRGQALFRYIQQGCNPDAGRPPHEWENSPY